MKVLNLNYPHIIFKQKNNEFSYTYTFCMDPSLKKLYIKILKIKYNEYKVYTLPL